LSKILIIDDYDESIALIKTYFIGTKHTFISSNNGPGGLDLFQKESPDLIILDVIMPGMDGFQVCDTIRENPANKNIPIIMVTGLEDDKSREQCFSRGVEYIFKPFNAYDIRMRVESLLQLKSYKDQLKNAEQLIYKLALIAESKDSYSAGSNKRLATFGAHFAEELKLDKKEIKDICLGSLLHSIGKIEIDEKILSKPGPLTDQEFEQIKTYPEKGEKIVEPIESFKNILPLIRHHKEQFDGSGYPDGLHGDAIPVNAQIVALSDCLNALTTDRPYRKAYKLKDAFMAMDTILNSGKLNPVLYKEFKQVYKNSTLEQISVDLKHYSG